MSSRFLSVVIGSVVIGDGNVFCPGLRPAEANPPLVVDPNAVLSASVARELLQPVAGRDSEVGQDFGGIEDCELPEGNPLNFWVELTNTLSSPDSC